MFNNLITTRFLKALDGIDHGSLTLTMPNGMTHNFKGKQQGENVTLILIDWRVIPLLTEKGDIGFAESYRQGLWESPDLNALFKFAMQNEKSLGGYIYGSFLNRIASRFFYLFTRNSLSGSKKNIHAHYDLGNRFYQLWLDSSMTYSSALYNAQENTLLEAQNNKYDRILNHIPQSGKLLEIGCGWGGFAERALLNNDYAIKALTISDEQFSYAKSRVEKAEIAKEDYRLQSGTYDSIVSIEMFEAVGESYWAGYFKKIKELLARNGKAVVQTITIDEPFFEQYKKSGDMIRTYIFPGGMLPTLTHFQKEAAKQGLVAHSPYFFGNDYAKTMQEWLKAFETALPTIKLQGFDDAFIRIWRFYLTICIASFTIGRTNVMQIELKHE